MFDVIFKYFPYVFLFLCALGGITLVKNIILGLWSYRWETVRANVVSAELESNLATSDQELSYEPVVTYEYSYRGNRYTGNRISYMPTSRYSKNTANIIVSNYLISDNITIKVNSSHPQMSVIEHGVEASAFVILVVVLWFAGAMSYYLYPEPVTALLQTLLQAVGLS